MTEEEKKTTEESTEMTEAGKLHHKGMLERNKLELTIHENSLEVLQKELDQDLPNKKHRAAIVEVTAKKRQLEDNIKVLEKQLKKALRS